MISSLAWTVYYGSVTTVVGPHAFQLWVLADGRLYITCGLGLAKNGSFEIILLLFKGFKDWQFQIDILSEIQQQKAKCQFILGREGQGHVGADRS